MHKIITITNIIHIYWFGDGCRYEVSWYLYRFSADSLDIAEIAWSAITMYTAARHQLFVNTVTQYNYLLINGPEPDQ